MNTENRYLKKIKAAHLIYKEKMRLQDVAALLGISRPTLAKLVEEMEEDGIVSVQIKYPGNTREDLTLAGHIRQKYGLRDVVVTSASAPDAEDIIENIGSAGADYFWDLLKKDMIIGVTGGRSIHSLISHIPYHSKIPGLQIITTTGGSLYSNTKYHANTLTQLLVDRLSAAGHFLYAPTYADDERQHEMILNNSQIKSAIDICKRADIVLTGIGDTETAMHHLPRPVRDCMEDAIQENLTGAINALMIRDDGSPLDMPVEKLLVGLTYGDLKQIDTVMALAGGEKKHKAIKAVLLGGYVSVLVTDRFTAKYLLQ